MKRARLLFDWLVIISSFACTKTGTHSDAKASQNCEGKIVTAPSLLVGQDLYRVPKPIPGLEDKLYVGQVSPQSDPPLFLFFRFPSYLDIVPKDACIESAKVSFYLDQLGCPKKNLLIGQMKSSGTFGDSPSLDDKATVFQPIKGWNIVDVTDSVRVWQDPNTFGKWLGVAPTPEGFCAVKFAQFDSESYPISLHVTYAVKDVP